MRRFQTDRRPKLSKLILLLDGTNCCGKDTNIVMIMGSFTSCFALCSITCSDRNFNCFYSTAIHVALIQIEKINTRLAQSLTCHLQPTIFAEPVDHKMCWQPEMVMSTVIIYNTKYSSRTSKRLRNNSRFGGTVNRAGIHLLVELAVNFLHHWAKPIFQPP